MTQNRLRLTKPYTSVPLPLGQSVMFPWWTSVWRKQLLAIEWHMWDVKSLVKPRRPCHHPPAQSRCFQSCPTGKNVTKPYGFAGCRVGGRGLESYELIFSWFLIICSYLFWHVFCFLLVAHRNTALHKQQQWIMSQEVCFHSNKSLLFGMFLGYRFQSGLIFAQWRSDLTEWMEFEQCQFRGIFGRSTFF